MRTSNTLFLILASIVLVSCFKADDYDNLNADDILNIESGNQTVSADGISTAQIKIRLSDGAVSGRRKVLLKTTLGSFVSGTSDSIVIEADNNLEAMAKLISLKEGNAIVTASIQNIIDTSSRPIITFTKAYPDRISVSVDSFSLAATYQIERVLTATLSKNNEGKPSVGHRVEFDVLDSSGNRIGAFLNGQNYGFTNSDGKASVRYSAGNTSVRGRLNIQAFTLKEDGSSISAVTEIFLTN